MQEEEIIANNINMLGELLVIIDMIIGDHSPTEELCSKYLTFLVDEKK